MKQYPQTHIAKLRQGFTLVETVIAMGIITIMITSFLAAFGPAVRGINKSISAKEANRLASTLEYELSVLRSGSQTTDYSTAFEKAFKWIEESGDTSNADIVLLYQYRGDPSSVGGDGTLDPQTDTDKQVPGEDYVLQSVVRKLSDTAVVKELVPGVVEGQVFYVRMNQLVYDATSGGLTVTSNLGTIEDPHVADTATTYATYPEAVIAYQAEFYLLKSSLYAYANSLNLTVDANGDGHPDALGKPVFTRNMAVRR